MGKGKEKKKIAKEEESGGIFVEKTEATQTVVILKLAQSNGRLFVVTKSMKLPEQD